MKHYADNEKRNVEFLNSKTAQFEKIKFSELKKGMIFRLWEPEWEIIFSDIKEDAVCWIAVCDAFEGPYGINKSITWTIESEVYRY